MQDSNPPLQAFKWKNAAPRKMKSYYGIATKRTRREMETNNEYGKYLTIWIILFILICFLRSFDLLVNSNKQYKVQFDSFAYFLLIKGDIAYKKIKDW